MINVCGLVLRRLVVGPCEDVGTLLDEWGKNRIEDAEETTAKLDQAMTLSTYGPARVVDAETAATLRRERLIAELVREASPC